MNNARINTKPLVSIGMPLYNGASTIRRALSSILAQEYSNLEIILSDDCSTDETIAICQKMTAGDGRVQIHPAGRNQGAIWNFNNTFRLSKGKYFLWAAQDDIRDPCYVSKCVELLENDETAVLCHCYYADVLESTDNIKHIRNLDAVAGIENVCRRFLSAYKCGIGATSFYGLIRSNALRRTHLWENYLGSDIALFNELTLHGKFVQVPEILFWYFGRKAVRSPKVHSKFLDPNNKYPKIYIPFMVLAYKHLKIIARSPISFSNKLCLWTAVILHESWLLLAKIIYKITALFFGKKRASNILNAIGLGNIVPLEIGYVDIRNGDADKR